MHAKNEIDEETRLELNVIQSDRSRNGEQRIGKYEKLIYWAYAFYRMQMTDLKVDNSEILNGIVRYRYTLQHILGLMS